MQLPVHESDETKEWGKSFMRREKKRTLWLESDRKNDKKKTVKRKHQKTKEGDMKRDRETEEDSFLERK